MTAINPPTAPYERPNYCAVVRSVFIETAACTDPQYEDSSRITNASLIRTLILTLMLNHNASGAAGEDSAAGAVFLRTGSVAHCACAVCIPVTTDVSFSNVTQTDL